MRRRDADVPPLAGFTVGVTAARHTDELAELLQDRGAAVVRAPALRVVPLPDDIELLAATERLLDRPPDAVVATTAAGFRDWIGAADGWGLGDVLRERLRQAELLARGPGVRDAVRATGLPAVWSPGTASMAQVLARLLGAGVAGRRVAVQLHGEPPPGVGQALRRAGAEVVGVRVHRCVPSDDTAPVDRLLDAVAARTLDAVAFTSAPAAAAVLERADRRGMRARVLDALRQEVLPACVGPAAARPLRGHAVPVVHPERFRLGPLAELLARELPGRVRPLHVAGHRLEIRGHAAVVDGALRDVPPAGMALLRVLAARPGLVVPRPELLAALPGAGRDGHAVETAVARLRTALGAPEFVRTVVGRGYRLALDAPPPP
ncbi:uroporphyrinogen-III synthase [Streptomyces sp. NPDC088354]|uniref:uroporphyrinogen-III synthase n=1 Tax=Streptomyces sp. NPDC088354 TaxID=3365856 RepID=UPI0038171DF1